MAAARLADSSPRPATPGRWPRPGACGGRASATGRGRSWPSWSSGTRPVRSERVVPSVPQPFSSAWSRARDKAREPRTGREHHSSERTLARCPLPLHPAFPLPAPGRDPPRTSPGRLPTPTWRTLGQALPTPFLRGSLSGPTLQRISHNNDTSLHPNRAVASELSEISRLRAGPQVPACDAKWTRRGRLPSPLPTRALTENRRGAPETPAG